MDFDGEIVGDVRGDDARIGARLAGEAVLFAEETARLQPADLGENSVLFGRGSVCAVALSPGRCLLLGRDLGVVGARSLLLCRGCRIRQLGCSLCRSTLQRS